MTAPYDHEALWAKAKVFLNRAMDPGPDRSFDEQALWASAALELLAKAALARVSPLLIAEPTEDGLNILIATGLVQGNAQFTSVSASTVFKRCERAFKPFSAMEAMKFAAARNEYLHGSGIGFMAIPPQAWWPRYWSLAAILITAQDRDVMDLVGIDRLSVVEEHLARNARNVEHRTEALIERARQRLAQYRAGTLPARIQAEWQSGSDLFTDAPCYATQECPACGEDGTVEGEGGEQVSFEYHYDLEDGSPVGAEARLEVPVARFCCETCHLVLEDYELITQAGLPDSFEFIDENPEWPEEEEPDYGND
ncbi:MAG TPA: hypothetical protein VMU94_04080 [Streptosporangiaceae bacterium]|nr:hypothetical protein [Streptosporangiaceae bacterium]